MARATLSTQTVNKPNHSPSAKCGGMQKPLPTLYIKVSAKSLAVLFLLMPCSGKLKNSKIPRHFIAELLNT